MVGPLIEVLGILVLVWAARNTKEILFERPHLKIVLPIPELVPQELLFKKVLIPTDFSTHAEYMLECISDLKKAGAEEVVLLHVIDPIRLAHWADSLAGIDEYAMKKTKEEVRKELEKIASKIKLFQKITTKYRVEIAGDSPRDH